MRHELEHIVAWRYVGSRKRLNAINIVSGVSAAAVCVVAAAMICVLSVMNGFGQLVESMFSQLDPELRIVPTTGKVLRTDDPCIVQALQHPGVAQWSQVLEETALVRYREHQIPTQVMGVDEHFSEVTDIEETIVDGDYIVQDGLSERMVAGQGVAAQLGISARFVGAVHLYAPLRTKEVNMLRPDQSFGKEVTYIAGIFGVNQEVYDNRVILVSIDAARRLFEYDEACASRLLLRTESGTRLSTLQRELQQTLGDRYRVENRYQQQADFYKIHRIEKWITALLLLFILLIASFNSISSLSMLIMEKHDDIETLRHLGANDSVIRRIFRQEGMLVTMIGAASGIVIGLVVCLLQQHFGWLKLGNGDDFVISAYPVLVKPLDIVVVALAVAAIGALAAWYPTRRLTAQPKQEREQD